MNPSHFKPLIQIKQEGESEKLSITFLITEEAMQELLDKMRQGEDLRAAISTRTVDAELVLEVYRPGESKNLLYAANIKRPNWTILAVATI